MSSSSSKFSAGFGPICQHRPPPAPPNNSPSVARRSRGGVMDKKSGSLPPTSPRPSHRRHRRTASVLPPPVIQDGGKSLDSSSVVVPMFRIGGKTDPGRFVNQHQQQFLILGFHDEERSDQDFEFGSGRQQQQQQQHFLLQQHQQPHLRLSFLGGSPSSLSSSCRNTLSPVREDHGETGLVRFGLQSTGGGK